MRCLVFIEAQNVCYLYPSYIDTRANHLAGDLSRNNASLFSQRYPTPTPICSGSATGHHSRMDLSVLAPTVQFYFESGLAPSTKKSYQVAIKRFCSSHNVPNPFPLSEHLLCYFAAYLGSQDLSPQTIKSYLSGLRSLQISMGLPDPRDQSSLPMLKRAQAGICRARAHKGTAGTRVRLPITVQVMANIKCTLFESSNPEKLVIWAIACTAFFWLL